MKFKSFNNPQVLTRSWYLICKSSELKSGQVKSFELLDFKVAVFRSDEGDVSAIHATCPHMGADLGKGTVAKNHLLCPYHKWAFDRNGVCPRIPGKFYNQQLKPNTIKTPAFPVIEKYGFIWIFNGEKADFPFPQLDWNSQDHYILSVPGKTLGCHPHIIGTNNPDFNHLVFMHELTFIDEPKQTRDSYYKLKYNYQAQFTPKTFLDRFFAFISGTIFTFKIVQHGSNLIIMDIDANNYQFRTLISLTPTLDGTTESRFFLFVPKLSGLRKFFRVNLLKLPLLLLSIFRVQMQDVLVYNNIDFILPEYEPTIVQHKEFIESLGTYHPTDQTRSFPTKYLSPEIETPSVQSI
jgi:nitrite reductase/ring-hydroxylating ferredoxin subunit